VGHPLADSGVAPSLSQLADQPLITYSREFAGRRGIDAAFAKGGLTPRVVLEAIDSDVIKAYVELGFGVGVIADIAVDIERDRGIVRLDASELFPEKTARIASRIGMPLLPFERRFMQLVREFR
jgi:LysR family cys regulon transcriptional activator